jgi:TolB protein
LPIAIRAAGVATVALLSTTLAAWTPVPSTTDITSVALADQQVEIKATIGKESGRLPRLAIPAFLGTGSDAALRTAAATLADVLWNDMEFEREYQMITQTGVAQVPAAPVETLPYDLWKQVSADEVLVGGIRQSGTTFQVDVRVMSVERKVATFARTYPCPSSAKGLRRCAHTIADEWHKERFGLDGVARTRFAFTSDRDGERQNGPVADRAVKEIYVSDYDGHGAMRVSVRGSLNIAPTWAPDGRAFAYQSYQSNFSDFYLQKLDEVQLQLARPQAPESGLGERG